MEIIGVFWGAIRSATSLACSGAFRDGERKDMFSEECGAQPMSPGNPKEKTTFSLGQVTTCSRNVSPN